MLIPQNRLLIVVALVVAPLAALGGLQPEWMDLAALGVAAVLLAAMVDGWLGFWRSARGLRFEFPEVVRLSKGRAGAIPLVVGNEAPGTPARTLRLGLDLPASVVTPEEELALRLPPGVERTRLEWPCTAARRGAVRVRADLLPGRFAAGAVGGAALGGGRPGGLRVARLPGPCAPSGGRRRPCS